MSALQNNLLARILFRATGALLLIVMIGIFLAGRYTVKCSCPDLRGEMDSLSLLSVQKDVTIMLSAKRQAELQRSVDSLIKELNTPTSQSDIDEKTAFYRSISVQAIADSLMSEY